MKYLAFFCALFLLSNNVISQNKLAFEYSNLYKVVHNGDTLKDPWVGGMNWMQFSTIDLDLDGIEDLVAFDRAGNRIVPMLKSEVNGVYSYKYAPEYVKSFPDIESWMLLVDYNCDGKKDIFCYAPNGIGVYENTSSGSELSFQWALPFSYLTTNHGSGQVNLYVPSSDLPAIADVDNDGDIDVLTNGMNSNVVSWHENTANCGLDFYLNTECWGRFEEDPFGRKVYMNACAGLKKTEFNNGMITQKTVHAGSTLLLLDLNNNGKKDLIMSDVDSRNTIALFNTGTLDSAFVSSQDTAFPNYDVPVNFYAFPGNFYEDVTHDGKKDLISSPNLPYAKNKNSVWLYENKGTANLPVFELKDTSFLQRHMIDLGEGAYPVLIDLDVDGRIDLLVSNMGLFQDSGIYRSSVSYYRNIGTQTNPIFSLITDNLANLTQYNLGRSIIPAFGDLDGDFDIDMMIGTSDGKIHYFENNGNISNPNFILKTANFQGIDVGNDAAPTLFDLNQDGYLDLIIGETDGNLNYYENDGNSNLSFTLITEVLGGVDMTSITSYSGNSVPLFYENRDTIILFVGSNNRGIVRFDSITEVMTRPAFIEETLGNGTAASTNSNITPFGGTKRNGRNQILYRASELKAAGYSYGTVKFIAFNIPINPTNILTQGITIKMKNVNQSQISGWDNDMVQVYDQLHVFYNGWNEINLSNQFIWDGTSDLLIEVCFSRNFPAQDIPVVVTNVGFNANAYGDIANWNNVTQRGCEMPYLETSQLRPNLRMRLVPTFFESETVLKDGHYNAVAIAELNGDNFPEAILGNFSGGLVFFKGVEWVNTISVDEFKPLEKQATLFVYPNPTTGEFNIMLPESILLNNAHLQIYDLSGRLVVQQAVKENNILVDLSGLQPGFYIISVNDGANVWRTKVVLK